MSSAGDKGNPTILLNQLDKNLSSDVSARRSGHPRPQQKILVPCAHIRTTFRHVQAFAVKKTQKLLNVYVAIYAVLLIPNEQQGTFVHEFSCSG